MANPKTREELDAYVDHVFTTLLEVRSDLLGLENRLGDLTAKNKTLDTVETHILAEEVSDIITNLEDAIEFED